MYRVLMVPLDGSAFGEHALPLALALARRSGAMVRLVHVCPAPPQLPFGESEGADAGETVELSRERAGAYLDQLAVCLSPRWEAPITTAVLEGPAAETLLDHALASGVDLVVMTTHAHGPLPRLWLGSVADALVRRLPLPILLVRPHGEALDVLEEVHEQPFQHILLPLDGSPLAEAALEPALELGRLMQARYTLLQAIDLPVIGYAPAAHATGRDAQALAEWQAEAKAYLERVAAPLRGQGLAVRTRLATTPPAVAILDTARRHGVDLIAMATHGRGGLARIVLGSVADAVLRSASTPVLLYRPATAGAQENAAGEATAALPIVLEE